MKAVKKYHPLFILRLLNLAIALLTVVFLRFFLVVFNQQFSRQPLLFLPFIVVAILFIYGFFRSLQIRLEISDTGIFYDSGSYKINTSWENVERIGEKVVGMGFPVEGLVFRTPSAITPSLVGKIFWRRSPTEGGYEADYSCSIPLQGIWSWNWRKSQLGEDIRRHLPHLF